jgi:Arc/MetJ family transcription regulator
MGRTNVVVDEALIRRVMDLYELRTKREAIDFALRRLAAERSKEDILALRGSGWEGDLQELRRARVPEL